MYRRRTCNQYIKLIVLFSCGLLVGLLAYHRRYKHVVPEAAGTHKHTPWKNTAREIDIAVTPPTEVDVNVDVNTDFHSPPEHTLEEVHRERVKHVKYVCASGETRAPAARGGDGLEEQHVNLSPLILTYCPDQRESRPAISHLLKDIEKGWQRQSRESGNKLDTPSTLRNNSLKVLYAGNPYWQLFTFYVNNVLAPKEKYNSIMRIIGKANGPVVEGVKCLVNVTYVEFINYVLRTGFKRTVGGVWNRCDVCNGNYDVIAKPETFIQDSMYIQKLLGMKNLSQDDQLEHSFIDEDMNEHILSTFKEKETSKCFSSYALLLRLWRQLQLWGYISINEKYPLDREQSDKVTMSEFKKMVSGLPKKVLYTNTVDAFTLAYSDVPLKELEHLRKYYFEEFVVFGYNDRPGRLFFKQGPISDFSYFDVINII